MTRFGATATLPNNNERVSRANINPFTAYGRVVSSAGATNTGRVQGWGAIVPVRSAPEKVGGESARFVSVSVALVTIKYGDGSPLR